MDEPPNDLPRSGQNARSLVRLDRGLLQIIDVSDPGSPRVAAQHAVPGDARQLLVEGDTVLAVVDEAPMFGEPPFPDSATLAPVTRLIRFDISDPNAPRRLGAVALDGEFWRLVPRAGSYWVLRARLDPASQGCDPAAVNQCVVQREAMLLTRFSWSEGAFVAGQQLQLPLGLRVYDNEQGFATAIPLDRGAELFFTRFGADGALSEVSSVPLQDVPVERAPLYFGPDWVALFAPELRILRLDGSLLGGPVALPHRAGPATRFTEQGVFVAGHDLDLRPAAAYVDLTAPEEPLVTALPTLSVVLPIPDSNGGAPTRALGWYQRAEGVRFSLLALDRAPPEVIDTLDTAWGLEERTLSFSGQRAFFRAFDGPAPLTGSLAWAADTLRLDAPIFEGYAVLLGSSGDTSYAVSNNLLWAFDAATQAASSLELERGYLIDFTASQGTQAALWERPGNMLLELESEGTTESLLLSPGATRVLPAGDRFIVLATASESNCPLSGQCAGYVPHVMLIATHPARVVTEIALPSADPAPGPSVYRREGWGAGPELGIGPGPSGLGERWLLERSELISCYGEEDCAAVGITETMLITNEGSLAPCPVGHTDCVIYGSATRGSFFAFDPATATLSEPVEIDAQGDTAWGDFVGAPSVVSRGELLTLRLEPAGSYLVEPPRWAHFLLDRLSLDASGALQHAGPVVVPGYPVALLDASTLLSVEPAPGANGSGTLRRTSLGADGVEVLASAPVAARYGSAQVAGDYVVYLRQPTDACEPGMTLESIPVELGDVPRSTLALPGEGFSILSADSSNVVLVGARHRAFARVHVGSDGVLTLDAFATAPGAVSRPRWEAGTLYGTSEGRAVGLAL